MCSNNIQNIVNSSNCIILDIEGTTTSIDFVKKELFPYAEKCLEEYVRKHWNEDRMNEIVRILIKEQNLLQKEEGFVPIPSGPSDLSDTKQFQDAIISHLRWQMAHDCKTTGLKKLQGYIWISGYNEGLIKGHIYEDVPLALEQWKSLGKKICIYSSGSIDAQKLLFQNSVVGNLDKFIDGNFDTTIGSKLDAESYIKIANEMHEKPENIVFFTDRPKEVIAAKTSGMNVIMVTRKEDDYFLKREKAFVGHEDGTLDSFSHILEDV